MTHKHRIYIISQFHKGILMLSSNVKVYCSSALQIHRFNEKHLSWTQSKHTNHTDVTR